MLLHVVNSIHIFIKIYIYIFSLLKYFFTYFYKVIYLFERCGMLCKISAIVNSALATFAFNVFVSLNANESNLIADFAIANGFLCFAVLM